MYLCKVAHTAFTVPVVTLVVSLRDLNSYWFGTRIVREVLSMNISRPRANTG